VIATGGVAPMSTSRMMPPPSPAETASTITPKMSIRLRAARSAPESAKAKVPSRSSV
jgi:hypothetical protein